MKINIERHNDQNCIENCFSYISNYLQVDCKCMFLYSWDMGYDSSKNTFLEKIHYHYLLNPMAEEMINAITKYTKIKYALIDKQKFIETIAFHKNDIAENIYLLSIDSYDCPWNIVYQTDHISHYFMVVDYSKQSDEFVIADPFCSNDIIKCKKDILDYVKNIKIFYKSNISETITLNDMINIIETQSENVLASIAKLLNDKMLCNIEDDIKTYNDSAKNRILRRIERIANARKNFRSLFDKCNTENLQYNTEILDETFNLWIMCRSIVMKAFFRYNNSVQTKICEILQKIHDLEKAFSIQFTNCK